MRQNLGLVININIINIIEVFIIYYIEVLLNSFLKNWNQKFYMTFSRLLCDYCLIIT